ncbi:unnamed protein product (mitochondrion) [Plasmodiophora brassicae]|uniref:protein-serine/threonine phosphatase n=1 Tax=Plasmodiophora brassicae TaxID=37360 RepID=A0A0G4J5A3_PLABS|nr:hypothetical protein PBRA_002692 [Plasmodiophora brassicae]SPQ94848.1 unnamed protein product [Plasmodiophora brassicae]
MEHRTQHVMPPRMRRGVLHEWLVSKGDDVRIGQVVGRMMAESSSTTYDIMAPCAGTLAEFIIAPGDPVDPSKPVAALEVCAHIADYRGLCARCGMDVSSVHHSSTETRETLTVFGKNSINITKEGLEVMRTRLADDLRSRRKLLLVLDLDHTIVHATVDSRARECLDRGVHEFKLDGRTHYVKLRPGAHAFLQSLKDLFDIQVFTWGIRNYAVEVVSLLDPDHTIIKERIVARDDIGIGQRNRLLSQHQQKRLERVLPVCGSMALVLDDSPGVWADLRPNLIEIRKFVFFPASEYAHGAVQNFSSGTGNSFDMGVLARNDRDNVLLSMERVLKRIHTMFYSGQEQDVRKLLQTVRLDVLRGCELVFSGVFPQNVPLEKAPEVRLAVELGATVTQEIGPETTHVIGSVFRPTGKIKRAQQCIAAQDAPLRHLVHVDWLTACSTHVARAPEDKFSLPDYVVGDVSQIGYLDAESGADEWTSSAPVPAAPTDHDLSSPRAKRPRTDDSGSDHDYSDFERELEAALGT